MRWERRVRCAPSNAQMEQLRAEWSRTQDPARKKELTDEIQRLAYEEVPYVSWGQWSLPSAYRTYVKGVLPFPAPIFWNVWLDKNNGDEDESQRVWRTKVCAGNNGGGAHSWPPGSWGW